MEKFDFQTKISTFTHDYYLLQLPQKSNDNFYSTFPIYKNCKDFRGQKIMQAPVIRIYGTNEFSQKCCCHVHGYFPSLYIKADQFEELFLNQASRIDFTMMLQGLFQQITNSDKNIVYRTEVEYRLDFYGYHSQKQAFLKIYLLNSASVSKMREVLCSGLLGGKAFQCYQAHVNYFMQFFSDLHIYGIHQMKVCGFTFRYNADLGDLFRKVDSNLNKKTFLEEKFEGFNLKQIWKTKPEQFNALEKNSLCYIQIDTSFDCIINAYEQINDDFSEGSVRSSDLEAEIEGQTLNNTKKMKIQITPALQQIWRDEKKRRSRFNINKPLEGIRDHSKNIEGTAEVEQNLKDPLWINFLNKNNNYSLLQNMTASYLVAEPITQQRFMKANRQLLENYKKNTQQEKQSLINKVHQRWQFYGQRKNQIINEIYCGHRSELPEWEEKEQSQQQSISDEDEVDEKNWNSIFKTNRNQHGNTIRYRGNYKYDKCKWKQESYFRKCTYCEGRVLQCDCEICFGCGEDRRSCKCLIVQQQNNEDQCQIKSQETHKILYQFQIEPPSVSLVLSDCPIAQQKPFYSNLKNLWVHYNIPNYYQIELKVAQYFDKNLQRSKSHDQDPVSIANNLKLPYFFTIFETCEQQNIIPKQYVLMYEPVPPTAAELFFKSSNSSKRHETSVLKNQDTFLSNLVIINYQIITKAVLPSHYGNPQHHTICAVILEIANFKTFSNSISCLIIQEQYLPSRLAMFDEVYTVRSEYALLSLLINLVFRIDPDIFVAFDQEKKGIRYLAQRGHANSINILQSFSRCCQLEQMLEFINFRDFTTAKSTYLPPQILLFGCIQFQKNESNQKKQFYLRILEQKIKSRLNRKPVLRQKYFFNLEINGRVNINISRICEHELKLRSFTLQAVIKNLFKRQMYELTDQKLFELLAKHPNEAISYNLDRVNANHEILKQLNIIGGIVQKCKVYGADFLSMMERGSQFKIESIMCRSARLRGELTLSASRMQVANQSFLKCRPFVMEPPKEFFNEPVLLFDFQSLYPSVMIAYNICYSTCIGSMKEPFIYGRSKRMGVSEKITIHMDDLANIISGQSSPNQEENRQKVEKYLFVSPNQVGFVRSHMKEGLIPKILLEFLISRIMIKDSSKLYKKESIKILLKERQIALKLFMNVMFGYTGASFSGRMPCSQIADSVVQISKYCLRKSIDYLNEHSKYKGRVLYGDTDSIFFRLPNHHIKQCFQIGRKLAGEITKLFPYPMQMKFEKVYESLVLVAKKRYYGKSYESQTSQAVYEGKGLQTVRRDGINLTSNTMRNMLDELMRSKDLSKVKKIYEDISGKLLSGQISQDNLTLAKQVRMNHYVEKSCPAHGIAAKNLSDIDPMLMPKTGERMKYLLKKGEGPLKNRCISVFQFMQLQKKPVLDYEYYFDVLFLPPLQRVFISIAKLTDWQPTSPNNTKKTTQCNHSKTSNNKVFCEDCLIQFTKEHNRQLRQSKKECCECLAGQNGICEFDCVQWNCKNLYQRRNLEKDEKTISSKIESLKQFSKKVLSW